MTRSEFNETPGPRVLRKLATAGASLAAAGVAAALLAVTALANGTESPKPTPPPCGSGLPTATCLLPALSGNVLNLPGIGTITLTITGSGSSTKITAAAPLVPVGTNKTITCTPKLDTKDGDRLVVVCTDSTTGQKYVAVVKVNPTTGALTAKVKVRKPDTDNDANETKDTDNHGTGTHTFGSGIGWTKKA